MLAAIDVMRGIVEAVERCLLKGAVITPAFFEQLASLACKIAPISSDSGLSTGSSP
jgi:hypothetical protein